MKSNSTADSPMEGNFCGCTAQLINLKWQACFICGHTPISDVRAGFHQLLKGKHLL